MVAIQIIQVMLFTQSPVLTYLSLKALIKFANLQNNWQ